MKKKRVLITGASGFIGRNLWEFLQSRTDLELHGTYLNNRFTDNSKIYKVDLTDRYHARAITKDTDCIIHAAALTAGFAAVKADPEHFLADNDLMNINLISAAHENKVKQFVFLSSTVVYPPYLEKPVTENDLDINAIHPQYKSAAWIKLSGENRCETYAALGRTQYTVLRHANIYGPYDKFGPHGHAFPAFITQAVDAKDGDSLIIAGDGSAQRDLLAAKDLARCIEFVVDGRDYAFDIFNAGSGQSISMTDLAIKIITASGKNILIKHDLSRFSIDTKVALDTSKIYKKFGWLPITSIDKGIADSLSWLIRTKGGVQ